MADDFLHQWIDTFSERLKEEAGEEVCRRVTRSAGELPADVSREETIAWMKRAMTALDGLVEGRIRHRVMTGCACRYPREDLRDIRESYRTTGDLGKAHQMLQEKFETFLRDTLALEEEIVEEVVGRGWGLAGVWQGDTLIATKIPKSEDFTSYLEESDPVKKRFFYCHCPIVRDVAREGGSMSRTFCSCGAGFYQGIWEEIIDAPVEVEVLETVLDGGEVCRFAIHLPRE